MNVNPLNLYKVTLRSCSLQTKERLQYKAPIFKKFQQAGELLLLLMHRTPHRVSLESIPHSRDAMLIAAPRKQHTMAVMKITWKLTSSLGMFLKD